MRNHDFPEVKDDDLLDITLYPEGGRACYLYCNLIIAEQIARRHPVYPHLMGIFCDSRNHLTKWYFFTQHGKTVEALRDAYLGRFLSNENELSAMERYFDEKRQAVRRRFGHLDCTRLTAEEIQGHFDAYFGFFYDFMVTAGTLRILDRQVLLRFREKFMDTLQADEAVVISGIPFRPLFTAREERAVLQVAAAIQQGKVSVQSEEYRQKVNEIERAYAWVTLGYFDEPPRRWSDFDVLIKQRAAHDSASALHQLESRAEDDRRRREGFLKSADTEVKALASVASWAAYLKDYYKYSVNELQYLGEPLFAELSRRSGLPSAFIKDLTPKEILELTNGKMPDETFVLNRASRSIVVAVPQGRFSVFSGSEAEEFAKRHIVAVDTSEREFRGRVASKGWSKGRVRIVLSGSDFKKVEAGDIVAVTNTNPDCVPIMRKAGAIVAEEGGLTAHVSVISREFGIPCVVGIPRITEILNDGDFVEVDAERGIVTILKESKRQSK